MTAVRSVESLKYGARLFMYFLAVVVVGGGGLTLGLALLSPEVAALLAGGSPEVATLVGGAVLAFLGVFVLTAGLFGLLYKLVADAVSVGTANGVPTSEVPEKVASALESVGDEPTGGHEPATPQSPTVSQTTASPRRASSSPDEEVTEPQTPSVGGGGGPTAGASVASSDGDTAGEEAAATSGRTRTAPDADAATGTAGDGDTKVRGDETSARAGANADTGGDGDGEGESGTDASTGTRTGDEDVWTGRTQREKASHEATGEATTEPDDAGPPADATGADGASEPTVGEASEPTRREPSPEEIAFGTTGTSGEEPTDADDEEGSTEESNGESVEPAGSSAAGDPLADPTDEE